MKNKKMIIKTKTDYSKIPNKLHFNIQLRTRGEVYKSKKAYDRKKIKQIFNRECCMYI